MFGSQVRQLVKADRVLIDRIEAFGIRAIIRQTGLSQHTLEKVRAGVAVRRRTLARILAVLEADPLTMIPFAAPEH